MFQIAQKNWLVILVSCTLVLGGCSKKDKKEDAQAKQTEQANANAVITVSTEHPKEETVEDTISANGTMQPWQEASIGSEVSGLRIKSVLVNVGDWVKKGQVLLTFQGETVLSDTDRSMANVIEAEASYANARDNANRYRQLAGTGAVSGLELTQAVNNEKAAKARLNALRASLSQQKTRQSYLELKSPDNGIISSRNATVGNVVSAGSEQFKLIRDGKLEWQGEVTPEQIDSISVGMPVTVKGLDKQDLDGKVRARSPQVDSKTKTVTVYVSLPKDTLKSGWGVSGLNTTGKFETGSTSSLTLPLSAFTMRDGQQYVYVVNPQSVAVQTKVTLGEQTGNRYEVKSGVSASDNVVTSGVGFLNNGDRVKVVNSDSSSGSSSSPGSSSSTSNSSS